MKWHHSLTCIAILKQVLILLMLLAGAITGSVGNVYAQADTIRQHTDCTIYLNNGDKLTGVQIWNVSGERVEYALEGNLHDLLTADILKIRCGAVNYAVVNDTLVVVPEFPRNKMSYGQSDTLGQMPSDSIPGIDPAIDYTAMARVDADKHYSMAGGIVSGFFTAPLLIVPPIIAAVEPSPSQKYNPNKELYKTIPEYKAAYRKRAHGKKAIGVLVGFSLFIILVGALVNS